ncbi:hypothetical protein [Nitrosopumilus sp. b1]|nr:hypothetical protein [Nitrosopumilus sp. b1]
MRKRVTFSIDISLEEKIRQIQAKKVQEEQYWYSFSDTVNFLLNEYFSK